MLKQNMTLFIHAQKTIINESDIDDVFESTYTTIISNIQKFLGKGSSQITDSVIDHNINISKYNPLAASSYIKIKKKIDHPRKGLINIQNIDGNACFKWFLDRYLNPAVHHSTRIRKVDKYFAKKNLILQTQISQSKLEVYTKLEKRIPPGYKNIKENHLIYVLKNVVKKNMLIYC